MSVDEAMTFLKEVQEDGELTVRLQQAEDRLQLMQLLMDEANARGFGITEDELRMAIDRVSPVWLM